MIPRPRCAWRPSRRSGPWTAAGAADALANLYLGSGLPWTAREAAFKALAAKSLSRALEAAQKVIASDWKSVDQRALQSTARVLSSVHGGELKDAYMKLLGSTDAAVRAYAVRGIAANGFSDLKDRIKDLPKTDPSPASRAEAERALGQTSGPPDGYACHSLLYRSHELVDLIQRGDPFPEMQAHLPAMGPDERDLLVQAVRDRSGNSREHLRPQGREDVFPVDVPDLPDGRRNVDEENKERREAASDAARAAGRDPVDVAESHVVILIADAHLDEGRQRALPRDMARKRPAKARHSRPDAFSLPAMAPPAPHSGTARQQGDFPSTAARSSRRRALFRSGFLQRGPDPRSAPRSGGLLRPGESRSRDFPELLPHEEEQTHQEVDEGQPEHDVQHVQERQPGNREAAPARVA